MYRALFIFDYREQQWRMTEVMDAMRSRVFDLNLVSNERLARVWIRRHLRQFHFMLLYPEPDDNILPELDHEFLEDRYLHRHLYNLFYAALIPHSHPCFYSTAHLRTDKTKVVLEYAMTN